jgi:murein DD-endopeptidase MepM/ murein hydrolase activator NlpD
MRERVTSICVLAALALAANTGVAAASSGGVSAPTSSSQASAQTAAPSRSATGGTETTFKAAAPTRKVAKRVARRAKAKRTLPKRVAPETKRPVSTAPTPAADGQHFFPVAGPHGFGGADARFGAQRAGHIHQGQDVTAATGTPLRAVTAGTIIYRSYQAGGAGYYFVLHSSTDGRDYVYMHLRETALYGQGTPVHGGERLGYVGATGDASGPHLHFEIWVGGWYAKGGAPIDPLPELKRWDA